MMMHFMHIRRNKDPADWSIKPERDPYVSMIKMREYSRRTSVQKLHPNRQTDQKCTDNSCAFPKKPFTGMMPGTGSYINLCVAMMYHVKFPHEFDLMHYIMRYVLSKKVHEEKRE